MNVTQVMSHWGQLLEAEPQLSRDLQGRFMISVEGEESHHFLLNSDPLGPVVKKAAKSEQADCELSLSEEDLLGIASGECNPQQLLLEGRGKVRGERSGLFKLSILLHRLLCSGGRSIAKH